MLSTGMEPFDTSAMEPLDDGTCPELGEDLWLPSYQALPRATSELGPVAPGVPEELYLDPPISLRQRYFLDVLDGHPRPRYVLAALDADPWPANQKLPLWVEDKAWSPAPHVLLYYAQSQTWAWMNVVTGQLQTRPPPFNPEWQWQSERPPGWRACYSPNRRRWFWWNGAKDESEWELKTATGNLLPATPIPVRRAEEERSKLSAALKTTAMWAAELPLSPTGHVATACATSFTRAAAPKSSTSSTSSMWPMPPKLAECAASPKWKLMPPARSIAAVSPAVQKSALLAARQLPKRACGSADAEPADADSAGTEAPGTGSPFDAFQGHKFKGQPRRKRARPAGREQPEEQLQTEAPASLEEALAEAPWRASSWKRPSPWKLKLFTCKGLAGVEFCKKWNRHQQCGDSPDAVTCARWHLHRCDLQLATGHPCGGAHTRRAHNPTLDGQLKCIRQQADCD